MGFARTVNATTLAEIQSALTNDALQALPPAPMGLPNVAALRRQVDAAVLNFTYANADFSAIVPDIMNAGTAALTRGSARLG